MWYAGSKKCNETETIKRGNIWFQKNILKGEMKDMKKNYGLASGDKGIISSDLIE